jgi:hypothetical protein
MFLLFLRLEDDFFFDEKRILPRVDRSAKKGVDFLASGRRYMGRNIGPWPSFTWGGQPVGYPIG